jgi:SpoVK/Ycf46/Vps4 family AAA+-type ATPase
VPYFLLHACPAAGTGKTSSARLLSRRCALPLVYVPLEGLVSKWYGESEQHMAKVRKCNLMLNWTV